MAERAKKNTSESDSGRNRAKTVLTFAVSIIVLTGIGIGVFYFLKPASFLEQTAKPDVAASAKEPAEIAPMVDIKEFIVNIISEDNSHYLKLSMTVELSDDKALDELNKRMPQIRDAILLLISNKTFDELYDLQGKKQLKAELLLTINAVLTTGEATAVYFTDFVVQ